VPGGEKENIIQEQQKVRRKGKAHSLGRNNLEEPKKITCPFEWGGESSGERSVSAEDHLQNREKEVR